MKMLLMLALAAPALFPAPALAQELPDPTRPPAGQQVQAARPGSGAAAPAPAAAEPRLQSVLIARAPGGRRVAVIDGQTVTQGALFRGATVSRIAANEVELRSGDKRQLLRLYPRPSAKSPERGAPPSP